MIPSGRIRAEQIDLLYRHFPVNLAGYGTTTALVALGHWGVVPPPLLLGWWGAGLAAIALCLVCRRAYQRSSSRTSPTWSWWLLVWAGLFGLLFAAGGLAFYPHGSFEQRVLILICGGGLTAAGTTVRSAFPPAFYLYLLCSLLPLAFRFAWGGDRVHVLLGVGILIYVAVMRAYGRAFNRAITESLVLRFEHVELVQELSRQRDEANRANVAKSKFLAAASHDLRQPLHALTLFASVLVERIQQPEVRKVVDSISASVAALEKLFNALLDVSRLDAGVLQPAPRHFWLDGLFRRLRDEHAAEAAAKGLDLEVQPCDAAACSDPALLERILRNYLSNALRYTEAGRISLCWAAVGDEVRIEVTDTGIGIPAVHQREIFEEFSQLGNPERDRAKGLGLGLAIVDRVARLLGHPIGVRSEAGRGSTFWVSVPRGDPAQIAAEARRPHTGPDDLAGLRALVVDDEADVREGMRTLLEHWGCQVTLAASEDEALAASRVAGGPPDAIIADYRLRQGRTGAQAIESIQAQFGARIPALIVTGDTAAERLRQARADGVELAHKPVPPAMLRAFLRSARRRPTG